MATLDLERRCSDSTHCDKGLTLFAQREKLARTAIVFAVTLQAEAAQEVLAGLFERVRAIPQSASTPSAPKRHCAAS